MCALTTNHHGRLFVLYLYLSVAAVANAMPDFHRSMMDSLRTPDQGADTVVWLAISEAATTNPSGRFYQGMLP